MRFGLKSGLVGVAIYLSICSSLNNYYLDNKQNEHSKEIVSHRHWNPLYRIGDPEYWLLGESEEFE